MNMGPFLNGYGDKGTGNVACTSRRGHVHRQASAPVDCAVRRVVTSQKYAHAIYIFKRRMESTIPENLICELMKIHSTK
jgi:hypothetical protein